MRKTCLPGIMMLYGLLIYGQQTATLNLAFNHLALSVKDIDRSVDFYKHVLDLAEGSTQAQMQEGVHWFSLGGGQQLHLISDKYYKRGTVITNKAIHLALTTNNFDELLKILDARKVNYGNWEGDPQKITIRSDGARQIYLQDPDGYWIEINSVGQK
jgi:lactoylglutathione lyase